MSSRRKDARWAHALTHIEDLGLEYEDLSYEGLQKFLNKAEACFNESPASVEFWYNGWMKRQERDENTN